MVYSLSSSRKYGNYYQKVMVTHAGSPVAGDDTELNLLKSWITIFDDLDNSTWEKETVKYSIMSEANDGIITVVGTKADVEICVVCNVSGKPKMTTFQLVGVTLSNVVSTVVAKIDALIGVDVTLTDSGIVNVNVNLHD